jgi:NAD(P)-dependent dehydrogenase (short-subunit alcohol dehydrogenase family)
MLREYFMRIPGKVAFVTGAASGNGRAIALLLAREGADVIVTDVNLQGVKETADMLEKLGRRAMAVDMDVTSASQINRVIRKSMEEFGKIDILVNNAGVIIHRPFLEMQEEIWDKVLDVNLKGVFLCSQAVAREMVKRNQGGKIINISSIAYWLAYPGACHYSASKGGVVQLTKSMAVELAPYKINVNSVAPGTIDTPMTEKALSTPEARAAEMSHIPWGAIGKPIDVAYAALFLASSESDYITGTTLVVDGGWITG